MQAFINLIDHDVTPPTHAQEGVCVQQVLEEMQSQLIDLSS